MKYKVVLISAYSVNSVGITTCYYIVCVHTVCFLRCKVGQRKSTRIGWTSTYWRKTDLHSSSKIKNQ